MVFVNILDIKENFEKLWHHRISQVTKQKCGGISICYQVTLEKIMEWYSFLLT